MLITGRCAVWLIAIISVSGMKTKLPEILVSDDTSREILFLDLYKRVSALEARVQMSDAVDWTQQSQFDALKSLAENQQAWLKDLDAIVRPGQCVRSKQDTKIAFFAYLSHDITNFKDYPTIIFDRVILNDGEHYSAATGIFRCPLSGVYDFAFFIGTRSENSKAVGLWARLVVNGTPIVMAVADQQHAWQDIQGGNRAILRLQQGDEVKIQGIEGGTHVEGNSHRSTTFSGAFLYE